LTQQRLSSSARFANVILLGTFESTREKNMLKHVNIIRSNNTKFIGHGLGIPVIPVEDAHGRQAACIAIMVLS